MATEKFQVGIKRINRIVEDILAQPEHNVTEDVLNTILKSHLRPICETCKKPIGLNEYCVDDGILSNVYHHMSCY